MSVVFIHSQKALFETPHGVLNLRIKQFVMWPFGAENTRDELRKQVYEAMAEEVTKAKSEDQNGTTEVKKENGSSVNAAEKKPGAPVDDVAEYSTGSPGKKAATAQKVEDPKGQNGDVTRTKPEGGNDESEAEQDKGESEGSKSLHSEHCWCGWDTGVFALNYQHYQVSRKVEGITLETLCSACFN